MSFNWQGSANLGMGPQKGGFSGRALFGHEDRLNSGLKAYRFERGDHRREPLEKIDAFPIDIGAVDGSDVRDEGRSDSVANRRPTGLGFEPTVGTSG